ncbi:fimbrial biogenesis chaperone [Rahnella victoriana]|uniref:fimbrial biogenesis chaperone n=1 Tax=Rahnella victoriana TaxID=1510570 RepID=UPI001E418EFF|nr:fimbria/pilus periplasmic chaperone [Rahnella victoriana]UHM93633.1 fimbria/pilus periplasmic chaperone [Rahnella victoriana]
MCLYTPKNGVVLCLALMLGGMNLACAGVVLNTTRVIYRADKDEATVKLTNNNPGPVLVQSWLDRGDENASPERISVPFVLTPPINRLNAGRGQTLRITYLGSPALPTDKETVYWLNVLEVPAKQASSADKNRIKVAFRTRIKLFYRPDGLAGNANQAPTLLQWQAAQGGVRVTNPTPYYVNMGTVTYRDHGKQYDTPGEMIAPGGAQNFHFKDIPSVMQLSQLSFTAINDYGAFTSFNASGR